MKNIQFVFVIFIYLFATIIAVPWDYPTTNVNRNNPGWYSMPGQPSSQFQNPYNGRNVAAYPENLSVNMMPTNNSPGNRKSSSGNGYYGNSNINNQQLLTNAHDNDSRKNFSEIYFPLLARREKLARSLKYKNHTYSIPKKETTPKMVTYSKKRGRIYYSTTIKPKSLNNYEDKTGLKKNTVENKYIKINRGSKIVKSSVKPYFGQWRLFSTTKKPTTTKNISTIPTKKLIYKFNNKVTKPWYTTKSTRKFETLIIDTTTTKPITYPKWTKKPFVPRFKSTLKTKNITIEIPTTTISTTEVSPTTSTTTEIPSTTTTTIKIQSTITTTKVPSTTITTTKVPSTTIITTEIPSTTIITTEIPSTTTTTTKVQSENNTPSIITDKTKASPEVTTTTETPSTTISITTTNIIEASTASPKIKSTSTLVTKTSTTSNDKIKTIDVSPIITEKYTSEIFTKIPTTTTTEKVTNIPTTTMHITTTKQKSTSNKPLSEKIEVSKKYQYHSEKPILPYNFRTIEPNNNKKFKKSTSEIPKLVTESIVYETPISSPQTTSVNPSTTTELENLKTTEVSEEQLREALDKILPNVELLSAIKDVVSKFRQSLDNAGIQDDVRHMGNQIENKLDNWLGNAQQALSDDSTRSHSLSSTTSFRNHPDSRTRFPRKVEGNTSQI
uniref:Mucin-2-like n=1 Tax=Strongyloides stercoralis TaxID=6248 RepID=A0A0K0ED58_STRER